MSEYFKVPIRWESFSVSNVNFPFVHAPKWLIIVPCGPNSIHFKATKPDLLTSDLNWWLSESFYKGKDALFSDIPIEPLFEYELTLEGFISGGEVGLKIDFFEMTKSYAVDFVHCRILDGRRVFRFKTKKSIVYARLSLTFEGEGSVEIVQLKFKKLRDLSISGYPHRSWNLYCPATNENPHLWGDYHFATSLATLLEKMGQSARILFKEDWSNAAKADVSLHFRGKYHRQPYVAKNTLNLIWLYSHPSDVLVSELDAFDVCLVASLPHYQKLRKQLSASVFPFLQCTNIDCRLSGKSKTEDRKRDVVFVGNRIGRKRPVLEWLLDSEIPLTIVGQGWNEIAPRQSLRTFDSIDNFELGDFYADYCCTINDHWEDMKALGYLNNRNLDSLASGTPVVSDVGMGFKSLFNEEILFYENSEQFWKQLSHVSLSGEQIIGAIRSRWLYLYTNFSFERRVRELVELVGQVI